MRIIGWIREGDRTACGGIVREGVANFTSHGRPLAFQGAHIACRKDCVIADGVRNTLLPNGRHMVIHGMKTSGGCPLYSTLNDIHGVGNASGDEIPIRFVQNAAGEWVGKMNEGYDQHFVLTDEETKQPLANRYYRMTCNGQVIEGKTDCGGKTEKVSADYPAEVTIEVMPEGYTGTNA